MLDVKVDFFSDVVDFQISPEPEVGSFGIDVCDNGNSDKFNLNSSLFFKIVDEDQSRLSNLFSLVFDFEIHVELVLDNDSVSFISDSLDFVVDGKVPFGFKIDDNLDVVVVKSFNFDDVVHFKIMNHINEEDQLSFFRISEEYSIVDCESFEFDFEFKLKSKCNFLDYSFHFNFDLCDNDVSFSGDSDSEFFDVDKSLLFNFEGLNNEPVGPVNMKVLKFEVELKLEVYICLFNLEFPFNSEVEAGHLSFLLDGDNGNVDVVVHFDSEYVDLVFSIFSEYENLIFEVDSVVFNLDVVINIELNYEFVDHNVKSDC